MPPAPKDQLAALLHQITTFFYYLIYTFVNVLIFVGEVTTFVFLSPFRLIYFVLAGAAKVTLWGIRQSSKFLRKIFSRKPRLLLPALFEETKAERESYTPISTIILHPTKSRSQRRSYKLKLNFNFQPVVTLTKVLAIGFITFVRKAGSESIEIAIHLFRSVISIFSEKVLRVVFSYRNLIFFLSQVVLVTQIFLVAVNNWIKKLVSVILFIFLLPWRILKLSVTTSFRYFYVGFLVCLLGIVGLQSYFFITSLPSPQKIGKTNYPLSTHMYDRNGRLLYEIYRDQNRTPIKLKDLPSYVSQASIAIEDKDFYHHNGISFYGGVLRALKDTWQTNELQGGSTITQQLIKTALLTPERTVERKTKEVILALWAENIYTKAQIIEMYLNQIPYGGSAYGIQEAARTYFGKDARQLDIGQAALLAGLTRAPSIYSPFINPNLAIKRRNEVLKRMYELNFITEKQRKQAMSSPLAIREPRTNIRAPHFVFYTKSRLENEYGIAQVEEGGLKVITSLDLDIQEESEKILREELDKIAYLNVTNGGIVVSDPASGEILAMVGSRDYFQDVTGAFNVTTALRQPGSSLKPVLYSLALEHGYTAATIIDDSPISYTISDTEVYKPVNYDGSFHGRVSVRAALANSYNIPAVKVLSTFGITNYVEHARSMGIESWTDPSQYGLSLALGGGEVTMMDETTAFGVFANGGYRVNLTPIRRLENSSNDIIEEQNTKKEKVLDSGVAFIISDILSDNNARRTAFGPGSALEIPGYKVAVKTGTTDTKRDNWTVGYTPEFVVTVWVGNNNNAPMDPLLSSGITGAAPIWHRVMEYLLKNKSSYGGQLTFSRPDEVSQKKCYGKDEYFVQGTDASVFCQPTVIKPQANEGPRTP